MILLANYPLRSLHTFGVDVYAKHFAVFRSLSALEALLAPYKDSFLVLGGGSNILFTRDFDGLVLRNELKGIELVREDATYVYVKAAAGENWHEFVQYCIQHGYGGLENLSLIPGSVGAAPMQNIGAYGVEVESVFYALEAFHVRDKAIVTFDKAACCFGYRESVFKRQFKNQFIILNVTFRLLKTPRFELSYGAIARELERMGVTDLSIGAVSEAIIRIRSAKLQDPRVTGNAGSFFKNPVLSGLDFKTLKTAFPGMVGFPLAGGAVKLSAGYLIEACGFKGYRSGDAGCHDPQALVLVNFGKATGKEIYLLSEEIVSRVRERFGVKLEREVNIY